MEGLAGSRSAGSR